MGATLKKTRSARRQSAEAPPQDAKSNRSVGRLVRGVLLLIIVAAGCYVAYGFGQLWAEWRAGEQQPAARQAALADTSSMAPILPLAGQWSFAELDWNIRSNVVERKVVDDRFETLATLPAGESDAQLPDVSDELVELAKSLKVKPIERAGNQIYRLDRANLKAQFVARVLAGRPKVVALAVAYPQGAYTWQLLELSPRQSARGSTAAAAHLLPLPAGAARIGGRFADDGSVLLELISLDSDADELFAAWKKAGWVVRQSGMGPAGDFRYLCARGEDVIYAWSGDKGGSLQNLMLVRTPTSSDTNP